jgi:hypothetical protein
MGSEVAAQRQVEGISDSAAEPVSKRLRQSEPKITQHQAGHVEVESVSVAGRYPIQDKELANIMQALVGNEEGAELVIL